MLHLRDLVPLSIVELISLGLPRPGMQMAPYGATCRYTLCGPLKLATKRYYAALDLSGLTFVCIYSPHSLSFSRGRRLREYSICFDSNGTMIVEDSVLGTFCGAKRVPW
jgi:hypothetical protein